MNCADSHALLLSPSTIFINPKMESDSDEDIENFDIFRDLDIDLMDVFTRSQRSELRRMARVHNLRTTADFVRMFQQQRNERIFDLYWLFGFLPLPKVNYGLLWRRHRPADLVRSSMRLIVAIVAGMMKISRLFVYGIAVFQWLRDILQWIFIYGSMVTFSPNFFVDIENYILRDNVDIIRTQSSSHWVTNLLKAHGVIIDRELWTQVIYDMVSSTIRRQCYDDGVTQQCHLDKDSLIFRVSDVIELHFPIFERLPAFVLTTTVVLLYLMYGFAGQLISFNVIFYFIMQIIYRFEGLSKIILGVGKILWHNGAELIV